MTKTKWKIQEPFLLDEMQYQEEAGGDISPMLARILMNRNIKAKDANLLLHDPLKKIVNPYDVYGAVEAAEQIVKAIRDDKTKFFIYADYDVDGLMSGYIMTTYLKQFRDTQVHYPERSEGYGLQLSWCKGLVMQHEQEPDMHYVVITVDNGIMKDKEATYLKEHHIDLIITDHHERTIPSEPDALAVCDPKLGSENNMAYDLCGAAVAWEVCILIDDLLGNDEEGSRIASYLPHVAIATVTDVMPMNIANAALVNLGLSKINQKQEDTFRVFMESVGILFPLTAEKIAWEIGPRLNACGRMGNTQLGKDFLFAENEEEKIEYAYAIDKINAERKAAQKEELKRAIEIIDSTKRRTAMYPCPVYVMPKDSPGGIAGGLAGQLAEHYKFPAVVFNQVGDRLVGSSRSDGCADLLEIFADIKRRGLDIEFGGHAAACGVGVAIHDLEVFINAFFMTTTAIYISSLEVAPEDASEQEELLDGEATLNNIVPDTYYELNRIPYANGLDAPRFLFKNLLVIDTRYSSNNPDNIQFTFQDGTGCVRKFWAWRQGNAYKEAGEPKLVNVAASIGMSGFGRDKGTIILSDIEVRPSEAEEQYGVI